MRDTITVWKAPPANVTLTDDEVHVWRAGLDPLPPLVAELEAILSSDEINRAERFVFPRDRNHFVVARGRLRVMLSFYLGIEPKAICFRYSFYGKPALMLDLQRTRLRFNVSHSQGLALYACTLGREIGIDLERIRPSMDYEQVAKNILSGNEYAEMCSLPAHLRCAEFFTWWSRKEAYVKARGDGLSYPLSQFDISLSPGQPAVVLAARSNPAGAERWSVYDLAPSPGYRGAVAIQGRDSRISCWQWSDEMELNSICAQKNRECSVAQAFLMHDYPSPIPAS